MAKTVSEHCLIRGNGFIYQTSIIGFCEPYARPKCPSNYISHAREKSG